MSFRPHETTRLPLEEFLLNLILEFLTKIVVENLDSLKYYKKIGIFY
jgi:hypothetical protein